MLQWNEGQTIGGLDAAYFDMSKLTEPIQRKTVAQTIIERFRDLVEEGPLKPGMKLPPERQLSDMWGVSRASLREALSALQVLGIVEIRHAQGVFLKSEWSGVGKTYADFLLLFNKISQKDLFETRIILETQSACLAARRRSKDDIQRLEEQLLHMEKSIGMGAYFQYGIQFHRELVRASHNNMLISVLDMLGDLLEEARQLTKLPDKKEFLIHKDIVQAITERDAAKTEQVMDRHFRQLKKRILIFNEENREGDRLTNHA